MRGNPLRSASARQLLDIGIPVTLTVLAITQLVSDEPAGNPALVTVGALAAVLPLAVRRRFPLAVSTVVAAGVCVQVVAGDGAPATFGSFVATMICIYTLAREARPPQIVAGYVLILAMVGVVTVLQARSVPIEPFEFVYPVVYFGLAGGTGAFVRQRALRLSAVEGRAAALERELEWEAELAAAQERTRIARELHDVVAHGLSLMVVQAEAAEELLGRAPDDAVAPLRRVQDTGREALGEMRRLLGVLRAADGHAPSMTPQPSLDRIPELVREAADVGLAVDVQVTGEPGGSLPLGLQLAAYRIVQEALTNTRRHARATRACVRLEHSPSGLRIEVSDDGHGPTGKGHTGHGLIGMRERVALYGGTLTIGTTPGGAFRVVAVLPREARP